MPFSGFVEFISNSYDSCMREEYVGFLAIPDDTCDIKSITCAADLYGILDIITNEADDMRYLTGGCYQM